MSLASYVIERRTELGLRATDLAAVSGLNKSYVSELERGKIALPNADIRRRLAKALGVSHLDLLVAAGEITEAELGSVAGVVERDAEQARYEADMHACRQEEERLPREIDRAALAAAAAHLGDLASVVHHANDDVLRPLVETLGIVVVGGTSVAIRYHAPYDVLFHPSVVPVPKWGKGLR